MKKIFITTLFLFSAISLLLISSAFADTVYDSSLQFNHAIADYSGNNYLDGATVKLILKSDNSINATATLNSTAGYSWTTGIGNGTNYYLAFYWHDILVYNGSGKTTEGFDFTTNSSAGASNVLTLTQQNLARLALTDNVNLWLYIGNTTGAEFSSVSYNTQTKELIASVSAASGSVSIVKVYHGADLTMPPKVFAGGQDITAYKVNDSTDTELGRYPNCWYYDAENRIIWIKGTHSSALEYKVEFAPSGNIPYIPPTVVIFNTQVPTLLLICAVLLLLAAVGAVYLIIASRR
jgi:hypothetical protein